MRSGRYVQSGRTGSSLFTSRAHLNLVFRGARLCYGMAYENVRLVYWEDGRGAMGNGKEVYNKMAVAIFLIKLTFNMELSS